MTEIITRENSLKQFLKTIHNTKVTIVTAFATNNESVIETLLQNGNQLTLLVGTINYFSDPAFIDRCMALISENEALLELFVDFREDDSVHWKLYLVEPDIVVIGSPNLTETGLKMKRDIAVHLEDRDLYNQFQALVCKLQEQPLVLSSTHPSFEAELAAYRPKHRQQNLRRVRPIPPEPLSFKTWVEREENQILPLFVWERDFTPQEKKEFEELIKPTILEEYKTVGSTQRPSIAKIGVWIDKIAEAPYEPNMVVLSMKNTGAYAYFDTVHRVMPGKQNRWWLCRVGPKKMPPFELTKPLKALLKEKAAVWHKESKTYLDSNDLRNLAKKLK